MNIQEALDTLAEYKAQADALNFAKQEMIDRVLTPEIRAQVADIEAEFATKGAAVSDNIAVLEAEIKEAVKAGGVSVRGKMLQAVYAKGRVSWDSKQLEGLMIAIPALANARKEGEPSVSIRVIG